jgi:hypothetical protein
MPRTVPGSYATVPVTDAQKMALSVDGKKAALELVRVLAAEQQVVSGVDYRL